MEQVAPNQVELKFGAGGPILTREFVAGWKLDDEELDSLEREVLKETVKRTMKVE